MRGDRIRHSTQKAEPMTLLTRLSEATGPCRELGRDFPILFSGPMVRAILREIAEPGTGKTETRRIIKPRAKPSLFEPGKWSDDYVLDPDNAEWRECDLRYKAGDHLWVRETLTASGAYIQYDADHKTARTLWPPQWKQNPRPSIHMPRWASRITLIVTNVKVERLQDITEASAIAEGIEDVTGEVASQDKSLRFWKRYRDGGWNSYVDSPIGSYASLWTEINGEGSWGANPWVAAYTFTPVLANIDALQHPASGVTAQQPADRDHAEQGGG